MVVWQVSQPTWVMTPSKPKREGKARPRTLGAFKRPAASTKDAAAQLICRDAVAWHLFFNLVACLASALVSHE